MNEKVHAACMQACEDTFHTMLDITPAATDGEFSPMPSGYVAVFMFGGGVAGVAQLSLPTATALAFVNRQEDSDHGSLHAEARRALYQLVQIHAGNTNRLLNELVEPPVTMAPPWFVVAPKKCLRFVGDVQEHSTAFRTDLGPFSLSSVVGLGARHA